MRRTRRTQRSFDRSTTSGSNDRLTPGRLRVRDRDRESSLQHSINSSESEELFTNGVSAQNSGRWNANSGKFRGKAHFLSFSVFHIHGHSMN